MARIGTAATCAVGVPGEMADERIGRYLGRFDLTDADDRRIDGYSTGMRKKVGQRVREGFGDFRRLPLSRSVPHQNSGQMKRSSGGSKNVALTLLGTGSFCRHRLLSGLSRWRGPTDSGVG